MLQGSDISISLPLVYSPKLLVLVDHLEKLSIVIGELQAAADTPLSKLAARPIILEICMVES
jgi:hypothetical protein